MEMPFPGATGRGLKIAVIDSGVHVSHPHIHAKTSGICIGAENNGSSTWIDALGHGTAVMAAIQEKAPESEYVAVKLFEKSLSTTSARLMQAIEWCISERMDLVNLSLGTPNMAYRSAFEALVEQAAAANVILICARHERTNPVLPGCLDGVISVDVDWKLPRHRYQMSGIEGQPYYLASGFPRPLPGVSPTRNLSGISFAVANMTGLIARACENMHSRTLPKLHNALASQALSQ